MGQIQVLNRHGDQTIEWDPKDEQSVAKAQGAFDALKEEGYEFFEAEDKTVTAKGSKVARFKKTLGKIIAAPGTGTAPKAMRGGPPRGA